MYPRVVYHSPIRIDESTTRCGGCDKKYPNRNEVCYTISINFYGERIETFEKDIFDWIAENFLYRNESE